ncbi:ubiquitin carboxyl-terminal hydrolase 37-like [Cottoperca gobio]|uniref:Ubiquitin carboxyl-terminal hydrolase 37-like n=1 Tax=Cottoperca gobio TaxID=56716 RepID=A0A6J2QH64_COTGO|nr:ubiquitin carboxyl-terminal hydrolase 37-like [Cottoperca gobio]
MNSSLQSLITLKDFSRDVSSQEEVWNSVPEAELIRSFMNVVLCQRSMDFSHKLRTLNLFRRALSVQAPEFGDNYQKDAHELLMTVFHQFRSLAPLLKEFAAMMGRSYRCPVEEHLVFTMRNTRTCKRCGAGSTCKEDFTNLSLNLVPGASVQEMLQDYLMETDLEFRCDCTANTSSQQSTFVTLPKVLMLNVKRFCFTPFKQMKKLSDLVHIYRELMLTSSQNDGWYSLVSIISHLGSEVNSGHYISDGIHPDTELDDPADHWLTFNDAEVTHTTGDSVIQQRQHTAFILFYQRRQM